MHALILIDSPSIRRTMYPFTLMREMSDLPLGLLTLREKWDQLLALSGRAKNSGCYTISSSLIPSVELARSIHRLSPGRSLFDKVGNWMATAGEISRIPKKSSDLDVMYSDTPFRLQYPWDMLEALQHSIELDFMLLTKGRRSKRIPKQVQHTGRYPVFMEKGARLDACFLNTELGPIYVGPNAEVQAGSMIKGPFLLGNNSVVKMGAVIYGPTVAGEACLLGGEVKRSLIFPFSNKAHHGYLGDSVIGSWCNWGAGASNSNLKNTGGLIRIDVGGKLVEAGRKAGVFMGDHSRTAINASLNSGSVIGVSTQLNTGSLTKKKISSFRWMDGKRYRFPEALEHIRNWKSFKGKELTIEEIDRLKKIYNNDK